MRQTKYYFVVGKTIRKLLSFQTSILFIQRTMCDSGPKKKQKKDGTFEAGKFSTAQQPGLFHHYNQGMGGVDLHDNAVQNYSCSIRSKKWYFPLFTTCLDSAVVNSWKIHCFCAKQENRKPMSQKDFRVMLTKALLLTPDNDDAVDNPDDRDFQQRLPKVSEQHLIIEHPDGKRNRCKQCNKKALYLCQKCNVALHLKCFAEYHKDK